MKKSHQLPALHLACSTDERRLWMNYVIIEDGVATATDRHLLACARVDGFAPGKSYVHRELYKFIHNSHELKYDEPSNQLKVTKSRLEISFDVVREIDTDIEHSGQIKTVVADVVKHLGASDIKMFSSKLFERALKTITSSDDQVYIHSSKEMGKAIVITSKDEARFCVVMPMMIYTGAGDEPETKYGFDLIKEFVKPAKTES